MKIEFVSSTTVRGGTAIVFCDESLKLPPTARRALGGLKSFDKVAAAARFKGKSGSTLDLFAPEGSKAARVVVIGTGKAAKPEEDFLKAGGVAMGKVASSESRITIFAETAKGFCPPALAAQIALGARLRAYRFDSYKTKKKDEERAAAVTATLVVEDVAAARKAWRGVEAVGSGVVFARELVNEPPNVLFPIEFARRAAALRKYGLAVEVLDVKAMRRLGMNALLGVGQGSEHESRVVILRWNGGKRGEPPVAFIGKGVCFDSGGISLKPGAGMEDMKGDMAGAACVTGLMQALAQRKARVNAIGAIGLVENMPDGNAQRPGDIVRSMSGQTIEIINTDAEGRLVLADVLWHVANKFKPKFMVDLATLTGAILIALGQDHAGLFSNNDELAERLTAAGKATGERVWRMPLGPEYDKLIDSKFADMKNTGGRYAGSITAAQFLQRFVNDVPWAHLDIAGTGMASPSTDINQSWGSGFGVRLLDRLVADHYER